MFSELGPGVCINAAILAFLQKCLSSRVWTVSPGGSKESVCAFEANGLAAFVGGLYVYVCVSFLIIFTPPYLFVSFSCPNSFTFR